VRYGCVSYASSLACPIALEYRDGGMATIRVFRTVALGGAAVATLILASVLVATHAGRASRTWRNAIAGDAYVASGAFAEAVDVWLRRDQPETIRGVVEVMASGPYRTVEVIVGGTVLASAGAGAHSVGSPVEATGRPTASDVTVGREGGRWILDASIPLASGDGIVRTREDVTSSHSAMVSATLRTGVIAFGGWLALWGLIWGIERRRSERVRRHDASTADRDSALSTSILSIDHRTMTTRLNGTPVKLSPKQYALLTLLASDEGRVFSDEDIVCAVWAGSKYADANDVRQCVYQLRRRLDAAAPGAAMHVQNSKGFGYRLSSRLPAAEGGAHVPPEEEESHVLFEQV